MLAANAGKGASDVVYRNAGKGPPIVGKPVVQPGSHTGTPNKPGANRTPGVPPGLMSYLSGGNLSPAALWAAAKALASAQTQGPYNELGKQIGINNQQTTNALNQTAGYFDSLGGLMKQSLGDETNIANQTNQQLQGLGSQLQGQLGGITSNAQQALAKYTPPADQGLANPAQQALIAEGARQQGLAAQDSGAAQTFGALQGGNYRGLAASNLGTGALSGQQELANIAQAGQLKNEPLTAKQATLRQQYGSDVVQALGNLRQQEVNNTIAEQGILGKNAALRMQYANDQANRNLQLKLATLVQKGEWARAMALIRSENNRARAAQQGETARTRITQQGENARSAASIAARQAAAAAKANGTGTSTALTPDQQNRMFGMIQRVQALVREPGYKQDANGNPLTPQQIWRHLQSGANPAKYAFPRWIIAAAFDLNKYGYITPQVAQGLRQHGLRPAQHGLRIQSPPGAGGSNPAAQVPGIGAIPGV